VLHHHVVHDAWKDIEILVDLRAFHNYQTFRREHYHRVEYGDESSCGVRDVILSVVSDPLAFLTIAAFFLRPNQKK
jgi:hypothetical protein